MRIYFDRVNRMGGINGRKVKFIALDDQGEPSRGAANAAVWWRRRTSTCWSAPARRRPIAPLITEAERSGTPWSLPARSARRNPIRRAKETVFCTTSFGVSYDNRAMIEFHRQAIRYQVQDRLRGDGDPGLACRHRYRRGARQGTRHDLGRPAGDPAGDAGLHAVRDQAAGRPARLGLLLGAVGRADQDLRGDAKARLEGPLHDLGAYRGRERDAAAEGPRPGADRRQCPVQREPADPSGNRQGNRRPPRPSIRSTRWAKAGSPAW